MIKRILALTLTLSCLTFSPNMVSAQPVQTSESVSTSLVKGLGGFDNVKNNPEEKVTRGEFSAIIIDMTEYSDEEYNVPNYFGNDNNGDIVEVTEGKFKDVPQNYPYYNEVYSITVNGFMNGIADNLFAPEQHISLQEAAKVLIDMMGYRKYALYLGGYPSGYNQICNTYGMTDGISKKNTDVLTQEELAKLIYNTLNVPVLELDSLSATGKAEFTTSSDKTFMTEVLKLEKINAIVTDNGITGYYSESDLQENRIKLDDDIYETDADDTYLLSLLGRNVTAYVTDRYNSDYPRLVYAHTNGKDEMISINISDVEDFNLNEVSYEKNSKVITKKISANVGVIYNGIAVGSSDKNILNYDSGKVDLIIGNDSKVRLIIVTENKYAFVKSIDYTNKIIYNEMLDADAKKGTPIELGDTEKYKYIYLKNSMDEDVLMEDIYPENVLEIVENGKYISIKVYSNPVYDYAVRSVINEDGKKYITDGTTRYRLSEQFLQSAYKIDVVAGSKYTIYTDENDLVVWITGDSDEIKVGYLISAKHIQEDEEIVSLKILTTDDTVTRYVANEKVRVKDKTGESKKIKAEKLYSEYLKTYQGIIGYTVDDLGEIDTVELIADKTGTTQLHKIFETFDDNNNKYSTAKFNYDNGIIAGRIHLNGNTKYIMAPDDAASDDDYSIVDKYTLSQNSSIAVAAYTNVADSCVAKYVVLKKKVAEQVHCSSLRQFVAVESVDVLLIDDEPTVKVVGSMTSQNLPIGKVVLYSKLDDKVDSNGNPCSEFEDVPNTLLTQTDGKEDLYDIKEGDIIRCRVDSNYYAQNVELVYRTFTDNALSPNGRQGALIGSKGYLEVKSDGTDEVGGNPYSVSGNNNTLNSNARYMSLATCRIALTCAIRKEGTIIQTTTLDLTNPQNSIEDIDEEKYISEAIPKSSKCIVMTISGKKVTTKVAAISDVKTYDEVGNKCSRILYSTWCGEGYETVIINEE